MKAVGLSLATEIIVHFVNLLPDLLMDVPAHIAAILVFFASMLRDYFKPQ